MFQNAIHGNAIIDMQQGYTTKVFCLKQLCDLIFKIACLPRHQQTNYQPEQSKYRTKNLNDKNLHESKITRWSAIVGTWRGKNKAKESLQKGEKKVGTLQARIRSISQRRATPINPYRHSTDKITHPHGQP